MRGRFAFAPISLALISLAAAPGRAQCVCPAEGAVIVGHRGDGSGAGENTVPAVEAAFAAGADMVEVDVQLSADGEVVLMHDATVSRTTDGAGCVAELTRAELAALDAGGAPVPTLAELLAATSGGVNVELKVDEGGDCPPTDGAALVDATLAVVRADAADRDVVISSFDLAALQRVRDEAPEVRVALLATAAADVDVAASEGFAQINLLAVSANARSMARIREAGLDVHVWTLDGEDAARRYLELGVDGVITDTVADALRARVAVCEDHVCPAPDAGAPDGGVAPVEDGGCAITGGRRAPWPGLWLLLAGLVARLGYAWRRCGS